MTPNTNYQRQLDSLLSQWQVANKRPHVLLHVCCAPCSSYVLEYLRQYCDITVYYYNPNITSEEEYRKRAEEVQRLIRETNSEAASNPVVGRVEYMEGAFDPRMFIEAVKGLENEPEGGKRCEVCFRLRLTDAARVAEQIGADYYTTSLTISPLKNALLINQIGLEIDPARWLPSDFKKKGGYLRSIALSREHGLYRQDYCGCVFSRRDAR